MSVDSVADVLANFLATPAGGSIGVVGTNLFTEKMPGAAPDACVFLKTLPGRRPMSGFGPSGTAPLARYPRVRLVVRDSKAGPAITKMRLAWSKLCNLTNLSSSPFYVMHVTPDGEWESMGENAVGNTVLEATFSVTMRET